MSKRVSLLFLIGAVLAVAVSCVESRHPLSDEKTSKIDERLIGMWKDEGGDVWRVTKSQDAKNGLEVEHADQNGSGRFLMFTTTIKSNGYMSPRDVSEETEKEPKPPRYDIYQYVFLDKDTVQVQGMEPAVILTAIADKKLDGEIKVTKKKVRPFFGIFGREKIVEEKSPVITATPEKLARYLESHAADCFPAKTDAMLTFKLTFKRQKSAAPQQ